jgi:2',5'-phosphodiesterase
LTQVATTPPTFRVVTYNILADQYAGTETARTQLFSACPPENIEPSYRRPLILGELLGYNADVICLQEVDDKMFTHWLEPVLRWAGFEGVYTNKAGKGVREGSAMFWRSDRFRMVDRRDIALKSLFPSSAKDIESAKYGPAFAPMLRASPALCTALQCVATIALAVVLEPAKESNDGQEESRVCVVNTHLFFHYAAPHIRTMHTWAILQEAAELARAKTNNGLTPALVFCGDLNSDLNDGIPGAIQLLATGGLPSDYWDWAFGANFKWQRDSEDVTHDEGGEVSKMMHTEVEKLHPGGPRRVVTGVDLRSPVVLAPADRLRSGVTNYVRGYQGLLDYVWYDPLTLAVDRVVPVPTPLTLGGFIPNRQFPSDHLAVVVDLQFKRNRGNAGGDVGSVGGTAGVNGNYGDEPEGPSGSIVPAALYNVTLAVSALREGLMLAVPTDTVYGVAACAGKESGVKSIYGAKRRVAHKPLAICVADHDDIPRYCEVNHLPRGLLEDLLPGPVTLVLTRRPDAPLTPELNPGLSSLGIRIPDCQFLRAVCRQHAGALALTSANLSGGVSTVAVEEFRELWKECAIVFDGGVISGHRSGSTIVDLTVPNEYSIERAGQGMQAVVALLREKYGLQPKDLE